MPEDQHPDRRDDRGGARAPIRRSRTWRRCTARPAPASSIRCAEIAAACARHGKGLIVDAMSSLRRHRDRRVEVPGRRGDRRLGQVHRGRARHGLRDRAPRGAREVPGQLAFARDGPVRPVDLHAEDDAVALHAAHARRGGVPRGARPVQGRGRHARRAARATAKNCDTLHRGHGGAGLPDLPAARDPGAGDRHLPRARRPGLQLQAISTRR